MADGILSMKMNCTAEDGSIYVTTDGSYTRNSYTMNTRITINTAGTEIISNAKITGKRIGDC